MKMTKKLLAIALVLSMVLSFVACETPEANVSANDNELLLQNVVSNVTDETVGGKTEDVEETPASPEISTDTTVETTPEDTTVEVSDKDENETVIDLSEKEETPTGQSVVVIPPYVPQGGTETKPETNVTPVIPNGEYNEGVVLVKVKESFNKEDLGTLEYTSAEPLYKGSKWYTIELSDASKTEEAVSYLSGLGTFENVDYDYIMATTAKEEENPKYNDQVNLGLSNIPHGWTVNGKAPGGSPDVVVAVIDTGVDYNHLDLRNNIWINTAEIADNGKDDDGNGYIDDVYGWDCVGNDNNPMDDNGHGTHVAGIIAAENNKEGGIGVAYNCKVMVLKAGNSSGYFNNSDIAEAIQYAYMNGASVINMSFGGSNISIAVEDALENAYNSCILVAAAGNDGACNNLACPVCLVKKVSYPAALPYVIGVMSTDKNGNASLFSNYDHYPYNSIEYEVYAVGEGVGSTWPSNKYACLNGTSMAAPTVSGIAALLRSYYSDREMYSTKFIQSQIVNTGTICIDGAHRVADVQEALTKLPTPEVNLYDYYIDDSTSINANNNGNGVVDAGETIRLYFSLHNRGGVATDVNVSIDTYRSTVGDETLTDPYFTFVNNSIQLSDIGTYSVRESGDKYFEIVVSPDCPNDYLADFNVRFTYNNGMDEKDEKEYSGDGVAQFTVSKGYLLPAKIEESITYKADKLYIVGQDVVIPEGVTVTFEEGCEIQFYDDREYYSSPVILVYGELNFNGTENQNIKLFISNQYEEVIATIRIYKSGTFNANYINDSNVIIYDSEVSIGTSNGGTNSVEATHSIIKNSNIRIDNIKFYQKGSLSNITDTSNSGIYTFSVATIDKCSLSTRTRVVAMIFNSNYLINAIIYAHRCISFENNILLNNSKNYYTTTFGGNISNNRFFSHDFKKMNTISFELTSSGYAYPININNNSFCSLHQQYASQIIQNYYDSNGNPTVDVYTSLSDASLLWPHVVSVEMFDKDGNPITTVGKEEITVRVTFNRDMDVTKDTYLTFGTIEPYADYRIDGEWISSTVWEGTYTLKAQIENGQNFLKVNNACAAEDHTKTVFGEYFLHEFTIDTTAAMAMNLQAFPKVEGIELLFAQDDYDTLLGYNIYRSEDKDGNFVKLNPTILLPEENTFLDDNAEPGKTYWYTYTVVLTDFSESAPAGKVLATALDTMSPSLYHTPVNQGYENNNLVISATATDNVAIDKVTLYYRTAGDEEWNSLVMSKQNDKFSATIFGSDVTLAGIEYYIIATDGLNTVQKGSAEVPYTVLVKSADSLLGKGDVDGNGSVTTKDALMLMQCLNGDLLLTDDAFKRADLNGDTLLSSAEALRILQYVNGNVTSLDM